MKIGSIAFREMHQLLGRCQQGRTVDVIVLGKMTHWPDRVQFGFYPRLTPLILLIYTLVLTSDWIGERLRLNVA